MFREDLRYYQIENFYRDNSYFYFEDEKLTYELKERKISVTPKVSIGDVDVRSNTYYFPAERIALPMINASLFELNLTDSTLPKYFLKFGHDYTKAKQQQQVFNIPLLGVELAHYEGTDMVTLANNETLLLNETSSAIQSNLPLLVILQYLNSNISAFVVEELELHNFPELQKKLLYFITDKFSYHGFEKSYVMLPTHSPYLLSAANNLLFAGKVGKTNYEEAKKVIPATSWIDIENFSAYFVKNGEAYSIVDEETGLIHENELNSISEDLAGEFDKLMQLYKPIDLLKGHTGLSNTKRNGSRYVDVQGTV
jgi:hypothetical protein